MYIWSLCKINNINCAAQITIADSFLHTYNFAKTKQYAIDQAVLNTRPHVELRLRNSDLSFEQVCVLAQLNNDLKCDGDVPQIDITSHRRDDILILVTVIWVILVVICIMVISFLAFIEAYRYYTHRATTTDNSTTRGTN